MPGGEGGLGDLGRDGPGRFLAFGFCGLVLGWQLHAAEIGGIALSTTSVAVVYAVMVETGLNRQELGKLILAACFITDLGTVLALGGLFASYGWLLLVFVTVSAVTLLVLPRLVRLAIRYFGHRVSEPEIKLLLVVLFGLGGLATQAGSEAVLPAYVAGLVVAGVLPARPGADGPAALHRPPCSHRSSSCVPGRRSPRRRCWPVPG